MRTKKSAVLLMAGTGSRLESSTPKQFHLLGKKPVYLHALERLLEIEAFDEIILVTSQEWIEPVETEVAHFPHVQVTLGGKTRRDSSYAGLLACSSPDVVLIHDAVRPFVSRRILEDNLRAIEHWDAVDTCIPSHDTLVYAPGMKKISSIPQRHEFLRGQTPQTFSYPLICAAHEKVDEDVTDDCSLVLKLGKDVGIVQGDPLNIKITTQEDLTFAGVLFDRLSSQQHGTPLPSPADLPLHTTHVPR